MGNTIQESRFGKWHIWRELLLHMNTYKVVFKKGYVSNIYHESIKAESIDEASMLVR